MANGVSGFSGSAGDQLLRVLLERDTPPPAPAPWSGLRRLWQRISNTAVPVAQPSDLEQKMQVLARALSAVGVPARSIGDIHVRVTAHEAHARLAAQDRLEDALRAFYNAFKVRINVIPGADHERCLTAAMRYIRTQDAHLNSAAIARVEVHYYEELINDKLHTMLCGPMTWHVVRSTMESLREFLPSRLFGSTDQKDQIIIETLIRLLANRGELQASIQGRLDALRDGRDLEADREHVLNQVSAEMQPLLEQLRALLGPQGRIACAQAAFATAGRELEALLAQFANDVAADVRQPLVARIATMIGYSGQDLEGNVRRVNAYAAAQGALHELLNQFNALCRNDANGNAIAPNATNVLGRLGEYQPNLDVAIAGTEITGGSIGRLIERLGQLHETVDAERSYLQSLPGQLFNQPGPAVTGTIIIQRVLPAPAETSGQRAFAAQENGITPDGADSIELRASLIYQRLKQLAKLQKEDSVSLPAVYQGGITCPISMDVMLVPIYDIHEPKHRFDLQALEQISRERACALCRAPGAFQTRAHVHIDEVFQRAILRAVNLTMELAEDRRSEASLPSMEMLLREQACFAQLQKS